MNAGTDTSSEPTESGDNRAVGAQLRAARDRRQLKLEEVARELHLDPGIIRAIEADDRTSSKLPLFQLPSARLIRNTILIMLGVILVWLAYPFAERLLASRNGKTEEQLPGRLELPPAFDSEQLFQQPEPAEHPLRLP
jgi:transcriptional regulator with XRE-family HTH domain